MCYIGTLIPALTVYRWGTDAQREPITDKMIPGDARFAVAISEPDTGSDAAALRCSAVDMGDHFVVNGQKMWCTGAGLPGHDDHDLRPHRQRRAASTTASACC